MTIKYVIFVYIVKCLIGLSCSSPLNPYNDVYDLLPSLHQRYSANIGSCQPALANFQLNPSTSCVHDILHNPRHQHLRHLKNSVWRQPLPDSQLMFRHPGTLAEEQLCSHHPQMVNTRHYLDMFLHEHSSPTVSPLDIPLDASYIHHPNRWEWNH